MKLAQWRQAQPSNRTALSMASDHLRMRSILQNGLLEPSGILAETRSSHPNASTPSLSQASWVRQNDDVIHMPVGISRNAFLQPNGMSDPQIALEQSFIVSFPNPGSDPHRWMKQTLLRGYQVHFAIHIDRTSFQHDSTAAMHGSIMVGSGVEPPQWNLGIQTMVGVLRPTIEAEGQCRESSRAWSWMKAPPRWGPNRASNCDWFAENPFHSAGIYPRFSELQG